MAKTWTFRSKSIARPAAAPITACRAASGDDAPIRCNDCGAPQGTIGELRAALLEQVLDHSAEALRRGPRPAARGQAMSMVRTSMRHAPLSPRPRPAARHPRLGAAAAAGVSAADRAAHQRMIVIDTHLDIPDRFDDGRLGFRRAPPLRRGRQPGRSAADGRGRARWRLLRHLHAAGRADARRLCRGARRGAGPRGRDPRVVGENARPDRPRHHPRRGRAAASRAGRHFAFQAWRTAGRSARICRLLTTFYRLGVRHGRAGPHPQQPARRQRHRRGRAGTACRRSAGNGSRR